MSAELLSVSEPRGNNGRLQGTTVGGTKPIHRFLKGQPKILGTTVLILGASFFILSIVLMADIHMMYIWAVIPPGFLLGSLLMICGIMYVLTDHNPTKKTGCPHCQYHLQNSMQSYDKKYTLVASIGIKRVTVSLSLSIITILVACWTLLQIVPDIEHYHYQKTYNFHENYTEIESTWSANYKLMGLALEAVFVFYTLVGAIILIVMSTLAGAALRSTKTQAIVMMTTAATETPVE